MEATVRQCMKDLKIPQHYDDVYKDECIYSFTTPFASKGLYVNLLTQRSVSAGFLDFDASSSGSKLYLLQKFTKIPVEKTEDPTKLAINVKGGFGQAEYEVQKEYFLHVVGEGEVPFPFREGSDFPDLITAVIEGVINHAGAKIKDAGSWEADQVLKPSKYASDLIQLEATKKISPNPKDWACEKSGDKENLWLNLSDGYIGGGRRNWDGSGGSNGALDHYNEEKAKGNNYPLTVKLGTITANGADIYSYAEDENDLVLDPHLNEHLSHWGIDVMKMEKSEKTVAEMEVDLNMNYDWTRICESGEKLEPLSGPGFVGLTNIGNTCYMNSTLQMVASIDEFASRYLDEDASLRKSAGKDAPQCVSAQLAKLINAFRFPPEGSEEGIVPFMLRSVLVKRHPEFSTNRQQDAAEFFTYFVEQVTRSEKAAAGRLPEGKSFRSLFEFKVEERFENEKKEVLYQQHDELFLSIGLSKEDGKEEPDQKKMKIEGEEPMLLIPFDISLQRAFSAGEVDNFRGTKCTRIVRMATMPRYLVVQLQRYYVDEKWCPNKLVCSCPMPDALDLEPWRARGKQTHEVDMPADTASKFVPDAAIMQSLEGMGFSHAGSIKACKATNNASAEQAMEYVFMHLEDPGFNDPEPEESTMSVKPDAGAIEMLGAMGFTSPQATKALKACNNDVERAADWLFSRAGDVDDDDADAPNAAGETDDGLGQYRLKGFISHIGRHTSHGHYVCHLKDDTGRWIIYDDSKVAKSSDPPLDLGYCYLYERQ